MTFVFRNRREAATKDYPSNDGENCGALHIPVIDVNSMRHELEDEVDTLSQELSNATEAGANEDDSLCHQEESVEEDSRVPKHIDTFRQQIQQRDEAIAAKDAQVHDLESQIEQLEEDFRVEREKTKELSDRCGNLEAELQVATDANNHLEAIFAERDEAINDLSRSIEESNQDIAQLREKNNSLSQSYQQLQEKYLSLIHELEEGTDRYTAEKKSALEQYTREAIAAWSRNRQTLELVSPAEEVVWEVEASNKQLQENMLDTTTSFHRDLNELGETFRKTIRQLDATRNAMRKELDTWQQGLYAAKYDRFALCLQTFDVEIWRLRKERIELVAEHGVSEVTDADELIDRLEMISDLLKDACANFGLHFFRPAQGDVYNTIRHQLYGSSPESVGTLRVEGCVAPGVESSAPDGGTALLRPALVTVVCDKVS